MSAGSLMIGILIGAVAGGIAALLLAPQSGKETRQAIMGKASQTKKMIQDRYSDISQKVGKMRDNMRSRAKEEAEKVEQQS